MGLQHVMSYSHEMKLKISRGGQVSVPAEVRKRWNTSVVDAEDHGDHLVLRPAPDDPIAALHGAFAEEIAHSGILSEEARRTFREEERLAEERKLRNA